MVQKNTRKKRHLQTKKKEKRKRKKHVWLSGRLHIEERLNEGPRLQRKHRDENEAKQNKRNTGEKRHGICKRNARRIQVGANQHESPLALGYPLLGPSRHVDERNRLPHSISKSYGWKSRIKGNKLTPTIRFLTDIFINFEYFQKQKNMLTVITRAVQIR